MPSITEMVEAEASAAEAETPDVDEELDNEPVTLPDEPKPETGPDPPSDVQIERAIQKLEAEASRHEKRVREIMGADFETVKPCPLCFTPGFVMPVAAGAFDPLQRQAVYLAMGDEPTPEYLHAPNTGECDVCEGYGHLITGAKLEPHITKLCERCDGKGWIAKAAAPLQVAPQYQPESVHPGSPFTAAPNGQRDTWNRPAGHPHFGMPPELVGV